MYFYLVESKIPNKICPKKPRNQYEPRARPIANMMFLYWRGAYIFKMPFNGGLIIEGDFILEEYSKWGGGGI